MSNELTPSQAALIPQYVSEYVAHGFYTSSGTREDDEHIARATERAYKNAISRKRHDSITKVPMVVVGSMKQVVHMMKQTIQGDADAIKSTIQSARHNGQFQAATDARFMFHLEVLGVGGDALEWHCVSPLYRKNGGVFLFPEICFCVRPPIRFDDDSDGNPVPIWNEESAPTVYTPQNPTDINDVTKYSVEDIEDLPNTVVIQGKSFL
jgi:hypothetical protein